MSKTPAVVYGYGNAFGPSAYNGYEALINAIVGAVYEYVRKRRGGGARDLAMVGLEKGIINLIATYAANYASGPADNLDVEYLVSGVLAGLYHSREMYSAAGDQVIISVISHMIAGSNGQKGVEWFARNVYGTTGNEPSAASGAGGG